MAIPAGFTNTLRRYGARSATNKAKLELWLDQAIEDIASNTGGSVGSASANGASFSMRPEGMTNAEWMSSLDRALQLIEAGIKSSSISYGNIY